MTIINIKSLHYIYIYLCLFISIYLRYFLVSYLYISTRHFYDLLLYYFVFLWRDLCIFPEGVDNRVFSQIQKKYTRESDIILKHKFYYIWKRFFFNINIPLTSGGILTLRNIFSKISIMKSGFYLNINLICFSIMYFIIIGKLTWKIY